jgi:hypothetical protein
VAPKRSRASATPACGAVLAMPLARGRWTAFQVVRANQENVELLALDWVGAHVPTAEQLTSAKPLWLDHHSWSGRVEHFGVSPGMPPHMQQICVLPVPELPACNSYASWPSPHRSQALLQHRWNTKVPEAMKRSYKEASPSPVELAFHPTHVQHASTYASSFEAGTSDAPLTVDMKLAWQELTKLPRLTKLVVHGERADLVEQLRRFPLITDLTLHSAATAIDLHDTDLTHVRLVSPRQCHARISADTTHLVIHNVDVDANVVVSHDGGEPLHVELFGCKALPTMQAHVNELVVHASGVVDVSMIAKHFPDLASLEVRGSHTVIDRLAKLASLTHLRSLTLHNCFDLHDDDINMLADATQLMHVEVCGHVKEQTKAMKAALKHVATVRLRGAKARAWVQENLSNPFRDWVDFHPRRGKAAVAIWKKAVAAMATHNTAQDAVKGAEAVLVAFIQAFNKLEDTEGIDTLEREQIWDAFVALAKSAQVSTPRAEELFEQRNF